MTIFKITFLSDFKNFLQRFLLLVSVRCFRNIFLNLDLFKMALQSSFYMKGASLARMYLFFYREMAIKYIENRAFCAFIHTNTYHVGTLIKRFRQFVSQKFFIEISSIPTLKCPIRTKLSKILLCSSMTCLSVQGDLKLNFYEDCTSNLKTALFFSNWPQRKDFLYCIGIYIAINVMERLL